MTHVWIPPGTPDKYVALFPKNIVLHVLPSDAGDGGSLGPGQFVIAGFSRERFPELVRRIEDVRVVQAMSAGIEDLLGHIPEGAILCDGAGIHDLSVAEWCVMTILATYRELPQQILSQSRAEWKRPSIRQMSDLDGVNVLIVGYGAIGRALEVRLKPFGVNIVRVGRHPRPDVSTVADLPALLPRADIVVTLLPLTPETTGFVDTKFISQMKHGALLVNPSRGRVVDTEALIAALREHRIRAALDVTEPEPLPHDHELWRLPGVLITPHIGGTVKGMFDRAWNLVVRQLNRYLNGEPLDNVVSEGY